LEGLWWENVDIFYRHLVGIFFRHLGYFITIWSFCGSFGTFFQFCYHVPRIIWQPCFEIEKRKKSYLGPTSEGRLRSACRRWRRSAAGAFEG
jgi:hypothetical protein